MKNDKIILLFQKFTYFFFQLTYILLKFDKNYRNCRIFATTEQPGNGAFFLTGPTTLRGTYRIGTVPLKCNFFSMKYINIHIFNNIK